MKFSTIIAVLWTPILALSTAFAQQRDETPSASINGPPDRILAEGDELADKKDYAGAVLAYKRAYDQIVPRLRKRKFLKPVTAKLMTRDQLKTYMKKLVDEEIKPEEFRRSQLAYQLFGMAPKSLDLKQTIVDLHTEEVAGFYNPKNKDMVLIKETEKSESDGQAGKKKSLFSRLFGEERAFDKEGQKITLAHEMTHALQDQHFDLEAMDEAVKHDDDLALAYQALVEGDATLLMFAEMQRDGDDAQHVLETSPGTFNLMFGAMRLMMPFAGGKTYRKAPLIVRDSMIFPYHRGLVFVAHLTNRDGWKAVDKAFIDLPLSTEQILHPAKYLAAKRDDPVEIQLPDLQAAAGEGWKRVGGNVLGEYQISIMLSRRSGGRRAAEGWDGDAYALFQNEHQSDSSQSALVWASVWDTEQDAQEITNVYTRYLRAKQGVSEAIAKDLSRVRWEHNDQVFHIERHGKDVVAVQGFNADAADRLVKLALQCEKKPKQFKKNRTSN